MKARVYRAVFALAIGLLMVGFATGAVTSYRTDGRPPAVGLIIYGAADHAEALLLRGEYGGALDQLKLYERTSSDVLPHARFREVFARFGPEERSRFAEVLRAHPGYAEAHYQLAMRHAADGDPAEAEAQLREVQKLRPREAEVYNDLGAVLAHQGRLPEAAAQLQHAIALRPDYAEAHANLRRVVELSKGGAAPD